MVRTPYVVTGPPDRPRPCAAPRAAFAPALAVKYVHMLVCRSPIGVMQAAQDWMSVDGARAPHALLEWIGRCSSP